MDFVQYVKESCDMQNAMTPEDYIGMGIAWANASEYVDAVGLKNGGDTLLELILLLGCTVCKENKSGVRKVPVTFANGDFGLEPEWIPRQLNLLIENIHSFSPTEVYHLFEKIHPFVDGNGRIGSLLFNMLNDTIWDPIHPPDLFS